MGLVRRRGSAGPTNLYILTCLDEDKNMHRVVVTGLGIVAPNGNNVSESWENTVNGKSGIGPITAFDASDFPVRIAGEVKNFSLEEYIPAKEAKRMDPFIHYGLATSMQAIEDSGFAIEEETPIESVLS